MLNLNRIAVLALAAAISSSAIAIRPTGTVADYGIPVTGGLAERIINITPSTRWVHVVNGETVTFVANGKSFSWHVYTYPNVEQFDLQLIAPADVAVAGVRVLVSPNPTYHGA